MLESHRIGIALTCYHNEVAPAQHEFSPIFSMTQVAVDQNQIIFELSEKIAAKHKLVILWHEKPFKGINGNGKHNNWSIMSCSSGGDTKQWFSSSEDPVTQRNFITFIACLVYAMNKHGDAVRCSIATCGNDHRLGAQEAPPGIMSLYTGIGVQKQIEAIIAGGPLEGYNPEKVFLPYGTKMCQPVEKLTEDRNRTAPLPYSGGNRFEFRAVGSSQNCAFPIAVLNTTFADGMEALCDLLDDGKPLRDAVALILKENQRVIFCGNGYGTEWPIEAKRRGLLNLANTPQALRHWTKEKNLQLFEKHAVFTRDETWGRGETLYEAYINHVAMEAETMLRMMDTGVIAALAKDLKTYEGSGMGGNRKVLYADLQLAVESLRSAVAGLDGAKECGPPIDGIPETPLETMDPRDEGLKELRAQADHLCYIVLPKMNALRDLCDHAETLCEASLWPFPSYLDILFKHHTEDPSKGDQTAVLHSSESHC